MTYNFKCLKCGKSIEATMRLNDYDKERKKFVCCNTLMERDYQPTAIFTSSSPNRY